METTGLRGLDDILTGLWLGDNVVWQVDDIDDYKEFVTPFVEAAKRAGKNIVYIRFADHPPVVEPHERVKVYELDAQEGFESFSSQVDHIITSEGEGTYYVFDCLSSLLSAWATDLMVGNFFLVTCPYLYDMKTIAYFAILRNRHSFKTIARIRETTQLLIDMYNCGGEHYIHPLKAWNRYSPSMFLPHRRSGDRFKPITDSVEAVKSVCYANRIEAESGRRNLDYWDRLFLEAEDMISSSAPADEKEGMLEHLLRIIVTRDPKLFGLSKQNFTLEDLVEIKSRMIGTGFIGGKALGMLLARKILSNAPDMDWNSISEPHDSFYIGSDVFYSYIVQNGWWKLRMEQKTDEKYYSAAAVLKKKMLRGGFPDQIMERFQHMLEYFGQSPIIVRSSSLLEDGFGNAFAGKYESFFCANQGSPEQRYVGFAEAVRKIYASTMNEDALAYRKQRGLDKSDEQMALLVQRVSGGYHRHYFFPVMAGVGISHNTYVWNKEMDPAAGMLRVVAGLGTRAVNRVEGDYPRIVALDNPLLRAHADMKDTRKFSQNKVDLIDVRDNVFKTIALSDLTSEEGALPLDQIGVIDEEATRGMKERGIKAGDSWVLTFDGLFSEGDLIPTMKKMLKTIEKAYRYPVDIEFTINFNSDGKYNINLVQCRPLQTGGVGKRAELPEGLDPSRVMIETNGYFFGGNFLQPLKRIIYVSPEGYTALKITDKYEVARIVGRLNRQIEDRENTPTMLLGPGRWGTTTPSLGVPVTFSEINNIKVLGEVAFSSGNLMPELSFGTHFFQDLVETGIFYLAIFPEKEDVRFDEARILALDDRFVELMPDHGKFQGVVRVFDVGDLGLKLVSDIISQKVICYSE